MSSVDKELISCIRKIKVRVHRNTLFSFVIWGIVAGLCLGSLVSIGSLLIPLYKVHIILLKIVSVVIVVSIVVGLMKIPKDKSVIQLADDLGLKERTATAVELIGREDGFAKLQKKDALTKLKELDYKSELVFRFDKRQLILILAFLFIIICSGFISTPAKSKAEEKYKFEIMREEKLASIGSLEKELKKNSSLNEQDKKELLDNFADLEKELKESKSINDINNAMTKFQIKTDRLKEKYKENDLNNLISGLSRSETTSSLAQAVENGDKEGISREISKLPEAIQKASEEEKKRMAQDFANMANNAEDSSLKNTLNDIAKKLLENNVENKDSLTDAFKQLGSSLQQSVDNRQAKRELKSIQNDFTPSKGSNSENNTSNTGVPGNTGSGNKSDVVPDDGEKPSQNNDKSSEGQNNQGGNSTDNKDNSGQENPSGFNKPSNNNSSKEESVYVPSDGENTGGNDGSGGGSPSVPSKPQSLESVVGKYKEKAYESMNSYVIPEAMKDIIKNYFSALEQ